MTKQEMDYFEKEFGKVNDNFRDVFQRLNQHGEDIAILREKTSFLSKVFWAVPTLMMVLLAALEVYVQWR